MTIHHGTVSLAQAIRVELGSQVDASTERLVRAWVEAWASLEPQWRDAIEALVAASEDGQWPTAWRIARARQAQQALLATSEALDKLSDLAGVEIISIAEPLTKQAADWEAQLIVSQMPSGLTAAFDRVNPKAIEAIVQRTTRQVTSLLKPLSPEATAAMRQTLVRGVALGTNPNAAADEMLRRTNGVFNGGRARAVNIARTELLDAYRAAALEQDKANSDTVTGWRWLATLDTRTCPSCLAQNGSVHPVDEPGPLDHQQGRCARVPKTLTWAEMGIEGITEPADTFPDAQAWFEGLSDAEQLQVMGAQRLALLKSGAVSWDDLAQRVANPNWRDSYQATPLAVLSR